MVSQIDAIFLDVGNTLRILTKNEPYQSEARRKITQLIGTQENPETFCQKLDERYKVYRKWAFDQRAEAPEAEMWTRWLAPEFPAAQIAQNAVELTYQYRQSMGFRVMVPDAKEVIIELHRRGYILGIISNVITSQEIPDWLEADGLSQYFQSVVLSSVLGIRKPDPAIYLEASCRAGALPHRCVYVGDNLKRDVTGTREAGFGMVVILLLDPEEKEQDIESSENMPDVIIHQFTDLLELFPSRPQVVLPQTMELKI